MRFFKLKLDDIDLVNSPEEALRDAYIKKAEALWALIKSKLKK